MSVLIEGLKLNYQGILAGMMVAAICAYIGVYVVLKRIVFVGASLAQISSAGIALAFLTQSAMLAIAHQIAQIPGPIFHGLAHNFEIHAPQIVSLAVTLIGTLIYSQQTLSRKIPQESIIGIGYLVASALTLIFIVGSPKGMEEVRELLDGSIIAVQADNLKLMAVVFGAVALAHLLFYKQFLFVSFDREFAETQGYRVRRWELLFYVLLGLTISTAIQFAGLLSVFAYMVIPAVTGLVMARRMPSAFLWAISSALISTFLGFCWSLKADLPTSPPLIAVSAAILAVVWFSRRFVREH